MGKTPIFLIVLLREQRNKAYPYSGFDNMGWGGGGYYGKDPLSNFSKRSLS